MSRILGIDYGRVRIGLAVSDDEEKIAMPLATISMKKPLVVFEQIRKIIGEKDVRKVVVGVPLNFRMAETEETRRAKIFAETVRNKLGIPVELENEVLSTRLFDGSTSLTVNPERPHRIEAKRKKRKAVRAQDELTTDALAAADILQRWLDREHKFSQKC